MCFYFFLCYGSHRELHLLTHSFPTSRSSDRLRDVRRPLFLTLASRDDLRLDTLSGAHIIRLPPLDEDEVRHAIGSIFAARDAPAPPPFLVDRIVARAGGCPLFVEELCHSASVPGAARGEIGRAHV